MVGLELPSAAHGWSSSSGKHEIDGLTDSLAGLFKYAELWRLVMTTYFWNFDGKKIPCTIKSLNKNIALIRVPDPYDHGEVEISVPFSEISST